VRGFTPKTYGLGRPEIAGAICYGFGSPIKKLPRYRLLILGFLKKNFLKIQGFDS
jgi:hypothetical protein